MYVCAYMYVDNYKKTEYCYKQYLKFITNIILANCWIPNKNRIKNNYKNIPNMMRNENKFIMNMFLN